MWGLRVVGDRPAINTPVEAITKAGPKREVIARVIWHGIDKSGERASWCLTAKTLRKLEEEMERWDEQHYYSSDYNFDANPWRKLCRAAPRGDK